MSLTSITGLDHFVVRVRDLDHAEAQFRRLGFSLTPRGFHAGRGSANHTVPLRGGNYFELLWFSPDQPAAFSPGAPADFDGPVAVALQTPDSHRVHAELVALGHDIPQPRDLSRPVDLPEGVQLARFLNASFPPVQPTALALFACQQLTRELVWRPEWEVHANGARRVSAVVLVHSAPGELLAQFSAFFPQSTLPDDGELDIPLGPTRMRFLSPRAFATEFPSVAIPADLSRGWFAGAAMAVQSLDAVRSLLTAAGIATTPTPGGLVVAPADAGGTMLVFHPDAE